MIYYMYKITNLVNKKIYVGVHKTQNLNDGYMGSGKIIRSAIAKHGISNFSKVILEYFDTSEAMYAREKEVVTDEFLLREDTYNLRRGGTGGFDYINNNNLNWTIEKNKDMSGFVNPGRYNEEWHNATKEKRKKGIKRASSENRLHKFNSDINVDMCKRAQTPQAKAKRTETMRRIKFQQGNKNSQFGTIWITDGIRNKKIKKDAVIPEGWSKGRKFNCKG